MTTIKLILSSLAIIGCAFAINAQKQVAVYVTGQKEDVKKVLGSKMTTYITQSNDFTAVERTSDFLNALMSEHDYQTSGEVSNAQIVQLGNKFGAQFVAVVDVSELFGELFISARLIDVKTAGVTASYEVSGAVNTMQGLITLANNIADGLILAPGRKAQEKQNAKMQAAREEQRMSDLRKQALQNLIPAGCKIYGRFIVQVNAIPVTFETTITAVKPIVRIPYGFRLANAGELTELYMNGCRWNNIEIITDRNIFPDKDIKSNDCEWNMAVFYNGKVSNSLICWTDWNKKHLVISGDGLVSSKYAVAIKDVPTEAQIQAEINRIK